MTSSRQQHRQPLGSQPALLCGNERGREGSCPVEPSLTTTVAGTVAGTSKYQDSQPRWRRRPASSSILLLHRTGGKTRLAKRPGAPAEKSPARVECHRNCTKISEQSIPVCEFAEPLCGSCSHPLATISIDTLVALGSSPVLISSRLPFESINRSIGLLGSRLIARMI